MAATKPKLKFPLYQALYRLNLAFESLAQEIEHLRESKTITPDTLALYRNTAEELRSAINHRVAGILFTVEERDWAKYGKARVNQAKV